MSQSSSTTANDAAKVASQTPAPASEYGHSAEQAGGGGSSAQQRAARVVGMSSPQTPPENFGALLGQLHGSSSAQAGVLRQLQRSYGNSFVGQVIQRTPESHDASSLDASAPASTSSASSQPASAPADALSPLINSASAGGRGLEPDAREHLEESLRADLSGVRVHTDRTADALARSVEAAAFTAGRDIYFREGAYSPSTADGMRLLAHESVHTLQQAAGPVSGRDVGGGFKVSDPGDAFEREAERIADSINGPLQTAPIPAATLSSVTSHGGAHALQRQPLISDTAMGTAAPPAPVDKIQEAIDSKDLGKIKDIHDFSNASRSQKVALIQLILGPNNLFVGLFDKNALQRIWSSYGADIFNLNQQEAELFQQSLAEGVSTEHVSGLKGLDAKFRGDVKAIALGHLVNNWSYMLSEMDRLNMPYPGKEDDFTRTDDPLVKEQQEFAGPLLEAIDAQKALSTIEVGYKFQQGPGQDYGQSDEGVPSGGSEREQFSPNKRPDIAPSGDENPPMPDYDEILQAYDDLGVVISRMTEEHPALYALLVSNKLQGIEKSSQQDARDQIKAAFDELHKKISKTVQAVAEEDLDPHDMLPIHTQLKATVGASGTPWNTPFGATLIDKVILKGHKANQESINSILGGIGMVAFLVAEFASGGAVTFLALLAGVSVSAGQAVASWEKFATMSTAADTAIKKNTALVTKEQVSGAFWEAVINSAVALLDLYGAGKTGARKFVRPGEFLEGMAARSQAYKGLKALDQIATTEERASLVSRAVNEMGVESAMAKSNKTADELLAIVGEQSEAGQRIVAYKALPEGAHKELALGLQTLEQRLTTTDAAKKLTPQEADKLVMDALDALGPKETIRRAGGWERLSLLLGNRSEAGRRLNAWRQSMWEDLRKYLNLSGTEAAAEGGVRRTGSQGQFGSDLDISSLGELSAEQRERARSFLAGRAGVDPKELGPLLHSDLFTDPRRMHLADYLPADVRDRIVRRRSRREQEMVLNIMLGEAEASGNAEWAATVRQAMRDARVNPVSFKRLTPAEIDALNRANDTLQQDLKDAVAKKDLRLQEELIDRISEAQAQINATERGGYMTGSGVSREVTQREKIPFGPEGQPPEMSAEERVAHLLDQANKLMHASLGLNAPKDLKEAAAAIRGVGKYGLRFSDMLGETGLKIGVSIPSEARFAQIAEKLDTWYLQAKGDKASMELLVKKGAEAVPLQARLGAATEGKLLILDVQQAIGGFQQALVEANRELTRYAGMQGMGHLFAVSQSTIILRARLLILKDASVYLINRSLTLLAPESPDRVITGDEGGRTAAPAPPPE